MIIKRYASSSSSHLRKFKTGDVLLLRPVLNPDRICLSQPLKPDGVWHTPVGNIAHKDVLNKEPRYKIQFRNGTKAIITHPTFEEYVNHRKRYAQPIYPLDASLIVSLADIHVDHKEQTEEDECHHFLEAGTGHGSLTLAICKAIHAANHPDHERGAVLHSVDCNGSHSKTGELNVREFRNGMYRRDVEFHVAESLEKWLNDSESKKFSGIFLDYADSHLSLPQLAPRMKIDAPLVFFYPSISQIQDCESLVSGNPGIDLTLVNVVELMPGMGGSLREWDVRTSIVKKTGEIGRVCRPRVGKRVVGGGFVAIFRKTPPGYRRKQKADESTE